MSVIVRDVRIPLEAMTKYTLAVVNVYLGNDPIAQVMLNRGMDGTSLMYQILEVANPDLANIGCYDEYFAEGQEGEQE